jgi:hypothetical protein
MVMTPVGSGQPRRSTRFSVVCAVGSQVAVCTLEAVVFHHGFLDDFVLISQLTLLFLINEKL